MTCKERLTIQYDGAFVLKGLCTIDRNGKAINCDSCEEVCNNIYDDCEGCPIQKCFDRLGELEDKLENGTLVELPCKVGDAVYDLIPCISSTSQKKYRIRQSVVKSIYNNQVENESICLIYISVNRKFAVLNKNAFGFTAFLTKEEAEARLKELNENG